ncbi:MAG: tRNA (adenosine(37)-N6)-threonylcarbamoyltransferase complex dimerization subunit type 1 TsaB [Crocinitomicaceae bacterium]
MALILNVETATKVCSVALAKDGQLVAEKESKTEHFSHSENLNTFIESLFESVDFELNDLDALAISMGPGSYTGLRIGVSSIKGLGYGLDLPVIGISSLKSLANLIEPNAEQLICPMFDARRMEVYSSIFNHKLESLTNVEAVIIENGSYQTYLNKQKVVFLGPGAEKCQDIITHSNAIFDLKTEVSAKGMITLAEDKFKIKAFENLAYFEPFYLKDFIAGKPKQLL